MAEAERSAIVVVALGTRRRPKVRATERALAELRHRHRDFLRGELRIEPRDVESGAPATPTTTEQCMAGARQRALNALRAVSDSHTTPCLGIGLEGGVLVEGGSFLESWAFVTDGVKGAFGSSGRVTLPAPLAETVLTQGQDLGPSADQFFARQDVAAHEGTFGVLTSGIVTREEAFVRSLLHALAPFYNARVYREV